VLKNGQEVMMNAGIQALVTGRGAMSGSAVPSAQVLPRDSFGAPGDYNSRDVSTPQVIPASQSRSETQNSNGSPAQGGVTKQGMLTPDSQGALGSSDIKVYTPLSEGSDGTVLLSAGKTMRLEAGTKLLIVIQPPPEVDPSLQ